MTNTHSLKKFLHAATPYALAAAPYLILTGIALAQANTSGGGDPFQQACQKLTTGVTTASKLLEVIGFLGIIGVVVLGYFRRWHWPWVFSLAGGLTVLTFIGPILGWLTSQAGTSGGAPGC